MLRVTLKIDDEVLAEREFDQDLITIGRKAGNDIRIDNLAVSGRHAVIERQCGSYYLVDWRSTNGTYLWGERVARKALNDGDVATIGKHMLVFGLRPGEGKAPSVGSTSTDSSPAPSDLDQTLFVGAPRNRGSGERRSSKARGARITVLEGATDRAEYSITAPHTLIGKDPGATIQLTAWRAPKVAGHLSRVRGGYRLVPPESGSRLKLNGQPVTESIRIRSGDTIQIQRVVLRFSC